jgi:glycosyltransferase involved in cell wall biosynthesis
MVVAGMMTVRNEERFIARNLRYHLRTQGFDIILVIDNGSYDGTRARVQELNDPRIQLLEGDMSSGFAQDRLFTATAAQLFAGGQVDWVVPFDADEFWLSRRYGSLRGALEAAARNRPEVDIALAGVYQMSETVRDDPAVDDPLRRVRYGTVLDLPRAITHRLGDRFESYTFGGHHVHLAGGAEPVLYRFAPDELSRVHYNRCSLDILRERLLNQAEGYIIRFGEAFLRQEAELSPRVHAAYNRIRNGTFDEEYQRTSIWNESRLVRMEAEETLVHLPEMEELLARA